MIVKRAVGIDLGTTNSAIAMLDLQGNEVLLLEDKFKRKTVPSMLGWNPMTEARVLGWEAWNRRVMEPQPVSSIKRKMGTTQKVRVGKKKMKPEEVSAAILEHLVERMETFVQDANEGDEHSPTYVISPAVVTVPAYFDAPQIEATRRAAELAGLEVLGLLQEPTAAAMYYAWKHNLGDGTFMVYDLGGGTFDVSVIRCMMGEYQVLSIDGDNYLGGDDFDRRLAEHLRKHLVTQGYKLDLDIANNADDLTRFTLLMRLAQEVKEALSSSAFQYIGRRDMFKDQEGNPVSIDMEFGKDDFEALIRGLVEQTIASCNRALKKSKDAADVGLEQIEHVLLVGGSTRVPLVQQMVTQAFCPSGAPLMDEPDTCVALGAAVHAANLGGVTYVMEGAQVTITSRLSTQGASGRMSGRVTGDVPQGIDSVVLLTGSGEIAAIGRTERTDDGLFFSLEDIDLPYPGRVMFRLELCDAQGDPKLGDQIYLFRVSDQELLRATGSALSNPTVLAKDITLEVVRDGMPDRRTLLSSGSSLPAEGKYRFYTSDRSNAVILKLFQNRFPIRTIHLTLPQEVPVGTPVDLQLSVDESMSMVASGEVSGQTFWAQIEPPAQREVKNWSQIESVLERAERVQGDLWGSEAERFREATSQLVMGIRETVRTDPDKLQVLVMRLEEILEQFHNQDTALMPGYERYSSLINAIKRSVYQEDGRMQLGLNKQQWTQRLQQIEQEADAAYSASDQSAWSQAFNQVQAIWESLAQDEYRFIRSDSAEYATRLHQSLVGQLSRVRFSIEDFTYASNPETRALQEDAMREILDQLEQKIAQPLEQLDADAIQQQRHQLDRMDEALSHIKRQIERLPTIGLVRQ